MLQDQAFILLGICQHQDTTITNPLEITESDIAWLIPQPEATQSYSNYLGGDVHVCEKEQDLLQILGCDFDWAEKHHGIWPNVTEIAMSWDVCHYLDEADGDPQWVIFVMCWNNAGGPVYYVPKHLWEQARVMEHIASTNPNPMI
ncbi:MAG: hypothetical protein B7Y34_05655 [Methylophilales bacterium 16-45-9]|nr:MAG: hypothetical protein B7Y34_05655 [Methylophilales bacterium 16-45-9]